ncbi:MAG: GAF domain-containing protein, partial [Proteobacteria bacterium]|nr:GAF domain-containing protein [Pseudomonadota bacterium]
MQLQTRSDGHELLLQLERSNWMLAAISKVHSAMIRARTEQQLYVGACEALTLQGAFELAWIGVPEHDEKISIKVRAKCGRAVAYLDGIDISWAAGALGDGPTGRAARSGQLQSVEDLMASADFEPWRLRAAKFQLHSAFALPIKLADGTVAAVLSIYSNLVAAFSPSEEQLLIRFAEDIGYGVESLRVRAAYQTALGKTERQNVRIAGLLEDSVRVLGAAMEKRDPYTAGHQQRVAALSVAIAQE